MKRFFSGLFVVVALIATPVLAQVSLETELTVQVLNEEWDGIVEHSLQLTAEEKVAFWPVYEEYTAEMSALLAAQREAIGTLIKTKGVMEEAAAHELLLKWFAAQDKQVQLRKAFEPQFAKVLPIVKVVRYFQVENRMLNLLGLQIAKDVPIIR